MTDVTAMRIGSERVTTDDVAEVRSPFDGEVVGRVPVGTEAHLDAAVAAALARHREGALAAYERAEILDRAALALAERKEEFARSIAAEAAKPIKTARGEADRAVDTFRFSAAVARTMAGELVPLDASSAGVGKLGFVMRVPIGVVAAISPFNFPLNLVAHKLAPAIAVRVSRGAQTGLGHAAHRPQAGFVAARRLRSARRLAQRRDLQRSYGRPPGHA